ncbi:MAG: hypothetical protein GXO92_03150 [FCB group bacterium]|nr:hypothetical protein [FCB group bacterium]
MKYEADTSFKSLLSFDIDEDSGIWIYGYPDTTIRHYDREGRFLSEFALEPEDLKISPQGSTKDKRERLSGMGNGFYRAFCLYAVQDKIIVSYKTRYPDRDNKSNVIAVYTRDGKFVKRKNIPYTLYKVGNALYYWKQEGDWWRLMEWEV